MRSGVVIVQDGVMRDRIAITVPADFNEGRAQLREGACPCGAVRFSIDGPVRDVLICQCAACVGATGGPWAASAAAREDLTVVDNAALRWESAVVSEYDARRGSCRSCGTVIFWDAPGRSTVSISVDALADASGLEVAGRIWMGNEVVSDAAATYREGLPAAVVVPWRD